MNVQINTDGGNLDIRMAGELTIYNAGDLRQRCMEIILHASGGMDARIDMSEVTEIDGSGIQLLVILKRELLNLGMFTKIVSWSPAVGETFEFVGIPEFLTEGPAWVE
jgi:anti-anti-sigma factor